MHLVEDEDRSSWMLLCRQPGEFPLGFDPSRASERRIIRTHKSEWKPRGFCHLVYKCGFPNVPWPSHDLEKSSRFCEAFSQILRLRM